MSTLHVGAIVLVVLLVVVLENPFEFRDEREDVSGVWAKWVQSLCTCGDWGAPHVPDEVLDTSGSGSPRLGADRRIWYLHPRGVRSAVQNGVA